MPIAAFSSSPHLTLASPDIDECRESNACGANSLCHNFAGNYTCSCQDGYAGDPYTGVSKQLNSQRIFFYFTNIYHKTQSKKC